jgi:integrase
MAKGIYEREGLNEDVSYYICYQFQGTDIKERVGRKSQGFTRESAKEAFKARVGRDCAGALQPGKNAEACGFFSFSLARRFSEYAAATWRSYKHNSFFINSIAKEFGDTPLSEITTWRIEKWKAELRKRQKPSSVNRHLASLKHMLRKAVEWGLMKSNPAVTVKRLQLGDQRARYLSLDEMHSLLADCKETRQYWLYPYVVLAINTGLRRGEMLSLRRSQNIDLEHSRIVLRQSKNQKVKTIPLNESARRAIEELPVIDDRLFPVGKATLCDAFNDALERAGIKDFHIHDLRHTFASHLVMSGVDLPTVSRLMGHSSIVMTMRYAHLSPRHEAEAVAKLDMKLAQNRNVGKLEEKEVVEIPSKHAAGGSQPL